MSRAMWLMLIGLSTAAFCVAGAPLLGQSTDKSDQAAQSEAAALEFARTHHPELATLLEQLQRTAQKEYRQAITELDRTRERLEKSRERMPERHALELAEWKVSSRIRLMAARLAMDSDAALETDLRAALSERQEIRVKLQREERDRLQKRIERLDQQIGDQERRREQMLEQELTALRKGAAAAKTERTKPAVKSKPDAAKSAKPKTPNPKSKPTKSEPAKSNPEKSKS